MPRYGIRKYPARDLFDDVVKGEETTVVTAMLRGEEACEKGAEVIHEMYRESIRLLRLNNALPFGEEWDEKLADLHYRTMLPILVDYMESFLNDGRMMDWFFAYTILSGCQLMTGFSFVPVTHEHKPEATLILQTILVQAYQQDVIMPALLWVPASPPPVYSGLMGEFDREMEVVASHWNSLRLYCALFMDSVFEQNVPSIQIEEGEVDRIEEGNLMARLQVRKHDQPIYLWPMYVDKHRCIVAVEGYSDPDSSTMNLMVDLKTNTLRLHWRKGGVFRAFRVAGYMGPEDIWSLITKGKVRRRGFGNGKSPGG